MKVLHFALALAASFAEAQIYHCETPQGPVFTDEICGDQAVVVTIEDDSAGITPGPSNESRAYLAQKREERARARNNRAGSNRYRAQTPLVFPVQQAVGYPAYWPSYGYRQRPVHRPRPERPSRPVEEPGSSGNFLVVPNRR